MPPAQDGYTTPGAGSTGWGQQQWQAAPEVAESVPTIAVESIEAWHQACDIAFSQKPVSTFPKPPFEPCSNQACAADKDRSLQACPCSLVKLFSGFKIENLKKARVRRWHPDKWEGYQNKL